MWRKHNPVAAAGTGAGIAITLFTSKIYRDFYVNTIYDLRRLAIAWGISLAIGCAQAATGLPACPPGAHAVGKAPPAGLEWRCENASGLVDGPWLSWYADGQLQSERHMKDGREHGRQRGWWPNGQLMLEGVSVDGNRYQGFKYWSFDGTPTDLGIQPDIVTQPAPLTR